MLRRRALRRRLAIAERVNIPGWLDPDATAQVLRRSDVLVLPTFIENLPMIILEGFARGVPVITTLVAAITEVVEHERNGLPVPVGDIEALAQALRRSIDDPDLRLRLGRTARDDHTRAYDIRGYAARLVIYGATWPPTKAAAVRVTGLQDTAAWKVRSKPLPGMTSPCAPAGDSGLNRGSF